ncbi:hypothetical protein WNY37_17390 [Henriciella sp. AS95]|uniref:hypothetical protein n=1 Tax=Henriciella sp. AS95 TaxID=3135782 RepID=UPI00316B627D
MTRKSILPMFVTAVASLAVLGGCVIIDSDEDDAFRADWDLDRTYGTLKGADVAADTVTARVSSNGCTTKDFIGADVRKTGEDRFSIGFFREKEDYCRAYLPEGVELVWTFAELGIPEGAEVRVRNEVSN